MNYTSTRDNSRQVTAQEAIVQGISPEGGLFVPETVPALTGEDLQALAKMTYTQRACATPLPVFDRLDPGGACHGGGGRLWRGAL